jgi:hypothetical protein
MISQKLLEQMIQKYGEKKQLIIVKEELAELIVSISKLERESNEEGVCLRIASVAEEEGDVRIMLNQLDIMMLKHDSEYMERVECEMRRKELRIRKMLNE